MESANVNSNIQFFRVRGYDHFSVISPVTEKIAQKIIDGKPEFDRRDLIGLK